MSIFVAYKVNHASKACNSGFYVSLNNMFGLLGGSSSVLTVMNIFSTFQYIAEKVFKCQVINCRQVGCTFAIGTLYHLLRLVGMSIGIVSFVFLISIPFSLKLATIVLTLVCIVDLGSTVVELFAAYVLHNFVKI